MGLGYHKSTDLVSLIEGSDAKNTDKSGDDNPLIAQKTEPKNSGEETANHRTDKDSSAVELSFNHYDYCSRFETNMV